MIRSAELLLALLLLGWSSGCDYRGASSDTSRANANSIAAEALDAEESETVQSCGDCELHLDSPAQTRLGDQFQTQVEIRNASSVPVILVQPGDGSDWHWRTPIVGWSVLPLDSDEEHPIIPPRCHVPRCGNTNCVKPDEVFALKPGESRTLGPWIMPPSFPGTGKYRVVFYYKNIPDKKWNGIPLGEHDAATIQQIRKSTPVSLISNEVVIEITE